MLPGRASLQFPMEDSNPTLENPNIDTHLDRPLGNSLNIKLVEKHLTFFSIGTRIQLLKNLAKALDQQLDVEKLSDGSEPETLEQNFPAIQEQSRHWSLNQEQNDAFILMAAALLQHINNTNQLSELEHIQSMTSKIQKMNSYLDIILPTNRQLVMFLAGSGGTGKSRVIQCFKDFARRWHSVSSTVISASSGVAAMLIGGCTIHSALGIGIRREPPDPTQNQINAWSEIGILFVDEFSMITPHMLNLIDTRLRQLKGTPEKLYGGIHLIFCGDFYQLPPVGSGPVYSNETFNAGPNTIRASNGRLQWTNCLTDVIELTKNHRQALEHFRINQPSKTDIDLVSSRYMFDKLRPIAPPPKFTMTAVPFNEMREKALRYCEHRLLERLPECRNPNNWRANGILLIKARIKPGKSSNPMTESQIESIRNLGSKKLGRSGNLYCIVDAPYIVTNNSDVSKGVANGTLAFLQDIILKANCVITLEKVKSGKIVPSVFASDVECLLFKHKNSAWNNVSPFSTLPKGWFPVIPSAKSIQINFNGAYRIKIQMFQLPCVLSLALTGHKTQGLTADSIILACLASKDKSGLSGWLYVILSRVKTIEGLFLMEKIEQCPSKYIARQDVMREMNRLRAINKTTSERLQSAEHL